MLLFFFPSRVFVACVCVHIKTQFVKVAAVGALRIPFRVPLEREAQLEVSDQVREVEDR